MDIPMLIAERAPGAFTVCDVAGVYRWVSADFATHLGHHPDDLVGRNAYEFIHPDDHAAGQRGHRELFECDEPVLVECRLRAADGTYRWVETASRLVRDEQAIVSTSRWVEGKQSVIETMQAERELASRFRTIDEQHRQFLTAISHRARHPITIIRGMTELLETRRGAMADDQCSELLRRISSNAVQLAELIEDVTQSERLTRRASRVRVLPIELHALVRDVLAEMSDGDAPITVTVPPGMVVFADPDLLRLSLRALVANAIGHTPVDTAIWVRARRVHDGTVISVEDAGPGIDPRLREPIFRPFGRGDAAAPDPGLGLGLHTVAEVAALHGGRTWVDDREGGGAAFHIQLPTAAVRTINEPEAAATPARGTSDAAPPEPAVPPAVRVLVVDDDAVMSEFMAMALEADGFDVDVAPSATRALQQLEDCPPDILVCDVVLPGTDGHELVRSIRATPGRSQLPVILCSALSDHEWRSWASGADSFLAKPFSSERLVGEVCRVLSARATPPGHGTATEQRTG